MSLIVMIRPGPYQRASKQRKDRLREILALAVAKGSRTALSFYLPTVALKTGALRSAFEEMITRQTTHPGRLKKTYTIRFLDHILAVVSYAKYHVRGMALQFEAAGYKKPTTSGTQPILPDQFFQAYLKPRIRAQLIVNARAAGFSYTRYYLIKNN